MGLQRVRHNWATEDTHTQNVLDSWSSQAVVFLRKQDSAVWVFDPADLHVGQRSADRGDFRSHCSDLGD